MLLAVDYFCRNGRPWMFDWAVNSPLSKVYFPISQYLIFFLCASPASTFLVLKHCLHYCVASFNYGDSRARDVGPTCWSFRAMPDSISVCDVNRGYYMLLLFLFVLLLLVVIVFFRFFCFLFFCFRDSKVVIKVVNNVVQSCQ